ncbi:MAG: endonuclease MutS2 [Clostridia bacterium]|nr:endonuclease MutS2 [Clostridia bacterium]
MDTKTLNKLEFNTVKEALALRTSSSLGKAYVETLSPETNPKIIKRLQDETEEGVTIIQSSGAAPLHGIKDVRHHFAKIKAGSSLSPEELNAFCDFLRSTRLLKQFMEKHEYQAPMLFGYSTYLAPLKNIEDEIEFAIEGNRIADRASSQLKNVRRQIKITEERIIGRLNKFMSSSDNKRLMQDQFYTMKSGVFCLPIKSECRSRVNGRVVELSSTGSTAYMTLNSVDALTDELETFKLEEENACFQVLSTLSGLIMLEEHAVEQNLQLMGQIDFIFAKSKYSIDIKGVRPKMVPEGQFYLKDLKHPALGEACVPIDFLPLDTTHTVVITGPNTGGKTVSIKMVGIAVLMHQCGIQIPAAKGSELPVFSKIIADIGDGQSMQNSLSTFSGHMEAVAQMLNEANAKSLLLIDEIGTGTDPLDGAALGISILEALFEKGAYTVVSTHYGEIKDFSERREGFENASMDFDRETLAPKYKLRMGIAGESNAYWIVKKLGVSDKVINRAKRIAENGVEHELHHAGMPREAYLSLRKQYLASKDRAEAEAEVQETQATRPPSFEQGDRVYSRQLKSEVLVYEADCFTGKVTVFHDEQMHQVDEKDLKLVFSRETLYPVGYDMDQLFRTFKDRKLERDIEKGRFKNIKELKARMVFNETHKKKKY